MTKYLAVFLIAACIGCIGRKKTTIKKTGNFTDIKIVGINKTKNYYILKGLKEGNSDTLFIVSYKEEGDLEKESMKTIIEIGSIYNFTLGNVRTRVSSMQQLGQFIIVGKDTLWKGGPEENPPLYYQAQNTIGNFCFNCSVKGAE